MITISPSLLLYRSRVSIVIIVLPAENRKYILTVNHMCQMTKKKKNVKKNDRIRTGRPCILILMEIYIYFFYCFFRFFRSNTVRVYLFTTTRPVPIFESTAENVRSKELFWVFFFLIFLTRLEITVETGHFRRIFRYWVVLGAYVFKPFFFFSQNYSSTIHYNRTRNRFGPTETRENLKRVRNRQNSRAMHSTLIRTRQV